jgi:hypothetical protein
MSKDYHINSMVNMEAQQTDTEADAPAVCHLLRVPAGIDTPRDVGTVLTLPQEIRMSIYRYLLLPQPTIDLEEISEPRIKVATNDNDDDDDDDGWVDDQPDSDDPWSDDDCHCSDCVLERELEEEEEEEMDPWHDSDSETSTIDGIERLPMYMNILRTNRQIYHEASSLLYTEAELIMGMNDILCLSHKQTKNSASTLFLDFNMEPPQNRIWRYNPLKGFGKKDANGIVSYKSAHFKLGGKLEPHVFARFQKITFELRFDDNFALEDEMWINDDTFEFNKSQAEEYKERMQRNNAMVKDFVKIISHSSLITHLKIVLEAEVSATSTAIARADDVYDLDDEMEPEEMKAIEDKSEAIQDIANERATELLVDTNLFDPLLNLWNVKNFGFEFDFMHRDEDAPPYQPQPTTAEKVVALKTRIESNFKISKATIKPSKKATGKGARKQPKAGTSGAVSLAP